MFGTEKFGSLSEKRTGQKKAKQKFKKAIDNTKLMWYNTYIKSKQYKINMEASGWQFYMWIGWGSQTAILILQDMMTLAMVVTFQFNSESFQKISPICQDSSVVEHVHQTTYLDKDAHSNFKY